jgi:ABC-2 type transport system permease protein
MKSVQDIWRLRLTEYIKETRMYLRYMFNDHLLFVLIFVVGGGAYWYQGWLKSIPADFPAAFVIAFLLTLTTTFAHVRTLLKEADIVFLLPLERKMSPYFRNALIFSYISQLYSIIAATLIMIPMYVKVFPVHQYDLMLLFIQLLLIKWWNQWIQWKMTIFPDRFSQFMDVLIRFFLNFFLLYFLISKEYPFVMTLYLIIVLYAYYFVRITKNKPLKWEYLIEAENRRRNNFYRIAHLFTDVPKLKNQVKHRKWMNWIFNLISHQQKNTYLYLFTRSFMRTGDYFGIFVRLLVIGAVILFLVPLSFVGYIFLAASLLFLTGIQLVRLHKQYEMFIIPQLYPVSNKAKVNSFLTLLFIMLVIQEAVFAIAVFMKKGFGFSIGHLAVNLLFIYVFVYLYIKKRFLRQS